MKLLLSALLTILLLGGCSRGERGGAPGTPERAAAEFYDSYLKLRISGLPGETQMQELGPRLSPELRELIEAARREQEDFISQHTDEKPPWIEGDLFTSSWEGAQAFKVGRARVNGQRAEVPVELEYRDGQERIRWTDTMLLQRSGGGWLVWDIRLEGDWDFKSGDSLRGALGAGG